MDPSLVRFRAVVEGALVHLESRRQEINDLNVFPGRRRRHGRQHGAHAAAVLAEVDRLADDQGPLDRRDRPRRDRRVGRPRRPARRARQQRRHPLPAHPRRGRGARQPARRARRPRPDRRGDGARRAARLRLGARAGGGHDPHRRCARWRRASPPRSRTWATRGWAPSAIRRAAERAASPTCSSGRCEAGEESVRRGPEQLAVLREAGVVDAGGHALTVIFAGVDRRAARQRGAGRSRGRRRRPASPIPSTSPRRSATARTSPSPAATSIAAAWISRLEALGDSRPRRRRRRDAEGPRPHRRSRAARPRCSPGAGEVSHLDVADMHAQVQARDERLSPPRSRVAPAERCGALAVVAGDGMRELYRVARRQRARRRRDAEPVDLRAARRHPRRAGRGGRRAAELAERRAWPPSAPPSCRRRRSASCPARSQQAGLAAALALDPARSAADNVAAVDAALERVRTGAVAPAARDDGEGRFVTGEAVGFVDDAICRLGRARADARRRARHLGADAEL